jgi:hypothetical protein
MNELNALRDPSQTKSGPLSSIDLYWVCCAASLKAAPGDRSQPKRESGISGEAQRNSMLEE